MVAGSFLLLSVVAAAVAYLGTNYRQFVFSPEDPLAAKIVVPSDLSSLDYLRGLAWLPHILLCLPHILLASSGKNALVIGGTKGIGRGISLSLAAAGANVAIVGRSNGEDVLEKMKALAFNSDQRFTSHPTDLTTVESCQQLVRELQSSLPPIDVLVFTVGAWPDSQNLLTSQGKNRVIALDVVARFAILYHLLPALSARQARVMSVLASARSFPTFELESVKAAISGSQPPTLFDHLSCGLVMDAVLLQAAQRYPEVSFVGTYPGFVDTEILYSTFPKAVVDIALALGNAIRLLLTERESGARHVSILGAKDLSKLSFYDEVPVGRLATPQAEDTDFQSWLWNHLQLVSEESSVKG
jgi:NAD(P)-dependent dehydrogenase (short-subunit alcohol dehydrogenase family)